MRARLTEEPDGRLCLETPYHQALVAEIKLLPYGMRVWDPERRRWLISALYAAEILSALAHYSFEVHDARDPAATAMQPDGAALWAPAGMPADLSAAFYQLGLNGEAPLELAEHAWKWWLRWYHPDVNGTGEDATAKKLNEAILTIRRYLKEP